MRRWLAVVWICLTSAVAAQADTVDERLPSPTSDDIVIARPARFMAEITRDPDDRFAPALRLRSLDSTGRFNLSFKLFADLDDTGRIATQEQVEAELGPACAHYVAGSVEKVSTLKHFKGAVIGAYCTFTDASLANVKVFRPGQFRHITLGMLKIGDYVISLRGYSDSNGDDTYNTALDALATLHVEHAQKKPAAKKKHAG